MLTHTLTLITGAAGVGKSTYGRQLSAQTGACLLDSDTVTEPVVRAGLLLADRDPTDRDSPDYKAAFRDAVYHCLYATAAENLPHADVILIGPFTRELQDPDWLEKLRSRFQCQVRLLFLTCDEEERHRRIQARGNPRDAAKLAQWAAFSGKHSQQRPLCPHELIQT